MATLWEIVAHAVNRMFSLHYISHSCNFVFFPFWFRGRDFGSDCTSFWSRFPFYFVYQKTKPLGNLCADLSYLVGDTEGIFPSTSLIMILYMIRVARNLYSGFSTRSDTNQAVLLQPSGQVLRILFVRMAPHTTESK